MEELYGVESNPSLDSMEIERLVDQVLSRQPKSVLDQLELPPFYNQLPFNAKWQIKDLVFDKSLSYRQKQEAILSVIANLPEGLKRFPPARGSIIVPTGTRADIESSGGKLSANGYNALGGGDGMVGMREIKEHSRLFDSFNALQYTVSFTFKLKELRNVLSRTDSDAIYVALANDELDIEKKLATVERVMADQSFEVLDQLFFVGVPVVDAEVRERFRRLWYDRPYWSASSSVSIANRNFGDTGAEERGLERGMVVGTRAYPAAATPSAAQQQLVGATGSEMASIMGPSSNQFSRLLQPQQQQELHFCAECMGGGMGVGSGGSQPAGIFPFIPASQPLSSNAFPQQPNNLQPQTTYSESAPPSPSSSGMPIAYRKRLPSMVPDSTSPTFPSIHQQQTRSTFAMAGGGSSNGHRNSAVHSPFSFAPNLVHTGHNKPYNYRPPTFVNQPRPEPFTVRPSYPVREDSEEVREVKPPINRGGGVVANTRNEDVPIEVTAAALALLGSREAAMEPHVGQRRIAHSAIQQRKELPTTSMSRNDDKAGSHRLEGVSTNANKASSSDQEEPSSHSSASKWPLRTGVVGESEEEEEAASKKTRGRTGEKNGKQHKKPVTLHYQHINKLLHLLKSEVGKNLAKLEPRPGIKAGEEDDQLL